jgi:hypothetical protein
LCPTGCGRLGRRALPGPGGAASLLEQTKKIKKNTKKYNLKNNTYNKKIKSIKKK